MGERYVNNMQQIMSANESQRNKIQFLQRQRIKRDHYLSDLQQNLQINKKTLLDFNEFGNNDKIISQLIQETVILANKLKQYYEQYMNINATLLMEKQMRLEDKQFYQQRMAQFENKIVDLRKYLHDKEESFTSVVTRLRKYQDLPEATVQEKLYAFKKELGEKSTNEFITEIIKDKNYYKSEYERLQEDYASFSEMKDSIIKKYPQVQSILEKYKNTKIQQKMKIATSPSSRSKAQQERDRKTMKKMQPNKQLIRLLKKQKLNNELLEHALAGAIQKNEELILIKSALQKSLQRSQDKCHLLYAENTIFSLRIAEYDSHYCRKYVHHRKFYEEGEIKGLRFMTEKRLKQYAETVQQYYQTNVQLHKKFEASLVEEVQKWGQFLADSHDIKKQFTKKNLLGKSASVPQLLINFQLDDDHQEEQMIIQEF